MTVEVKRIDLERLFEDFGARVRAELTRREPNKDETRDENGARVVTVMAEDRTSTKDGAG